MDGYGYKNWDKEGDSFDETPPSRGGGRAYGFKEEKSDEYDFDISGEADADAAEDKSQGMTRDRRQVGARRMSTDQRMQEILDRNKKAESDRRAANVGSVSPEAAGVQSSIQSSWDDLVGDMDAMKAGVDPMETSNMSGSLSEADSPLAAGRGTYGGDPGSAGGRGGAGGGGAGRRDMSNTSFGEGSDSFDISEGDFEVGAYAAARSKEKTAERRRRSTNVDPSSLYPNPTKAAAERAGHEILKAAARGTHSSQPQKVAASPEVRDRRRAHQQGSGLLGSTALSSIDNNEADAYQQDPEGDVRYGSLDQSDDNLYEALARTNAGQGRPPLRDAPSGRMATGTGTGMGSRYQTETSAYSSERSSLDMTGSLSAAKGGARDDHNNDDDDDYGSDDFDDNEGDAKDTKNTPAPAQEQDLGSPGAQARRSSVEDIKARWLNPQLSSENLVAKAAAAAGNADAESGSEGVAAVAAVPFSAATPEEQASSPVPVSEDAHGPAADDDGDNENDTSAAAAADTSANNNDNEGRTGHEAGDSVMMRSLDAPDLPVYSPGTHKLTSSGGFGRASLASAPDSPGGPPPPPASSSSRDTSTVSEQQSSASVSLISSRDGPLVGAAHAAGRPAMAPVREEQSQSQSQSGTLEGLQFAPSASKAPAPLRDAHGLPPAAAPAMPLPVLAPAAPVDAPMTQSERQELQDGNAGGGQMRTYDFDGVFTKAGVPMPVAPEPQLEPEAKPTGAPVDLATLGFNTDLSRATSASVEATARPSGVRAPASRTPPEWPSAIPVKAPSATELSASLSMLRARQKASTAGRGTPGSAQAARRAAAAAKVSAGARAEAARVSAEGARVTRAQPRSARVSSDGTASASASASVASSSSAAKVSAARAPASAAGSVSGSSTATGNDNNAGKGPRKPSPLRVEKVEQSTARLAKQFGELEKQMQDLRKMQSVVKNGKSPSRITIAPKAVPMPMESVAEAAAAGQHQHQRQPSRTMVASQPQPLTPGRSVSPPPPTGGRGRRSAPASADPADAWLGASRDAPPAAPGARSWDDEAMDTVMKVVAESAQLALKEKQLQDREEAVLLRESLADGRGIQTHLSGRQSGGYGGGGDGDFAFPSRLPELTQQERAAASKVLPHELTAHYTEREQALLREVETLKTHLSDLKQSNKAAFPATKRIAHAAEAQEAAVQSGAHSLAPVEVDGMVSIPAADLLKLHAELESQEKLLAGYQKENEKLVKVVKELEIAEQVRVTKFVEQQEVLNKEVNRLRNTQHASDLDGARAGAGAGAGADGEAVGGVTGNMHRSAVALQQELEAAALVRNMKERLGEEKAAFAQRERELQGTIEKLRGENRQLITNHRFGAGQDRQAMEDVAAAVAEERRVHSSETSELRAKLAWFAENQDMLDKGEDEKKLLRETLLALRKELHKRKGGGAGGAGAAVDDLDTSVVGGGGRARGSGTRSPSDVRRIKELEGVVKDLQDSLQKRHPDSVSSLIRAATVSESVEVRQSARDREVSALRRDAVLAKEESDTRLRGLRQEHESVKVRYETRLRGLTDELAKARKTSASVGAGASVEVPVGASVVTLDPAAQGGGVDVSSLSAAQTRVRELELELERVRTFYTKKVEETRRVAQSQIQVFKRKSASPDAGSPAPVPYRAASPSPSPGPSQATFNMNMGMTMDGEYPDGLGAPPLPVPAPAAPGQTPAQRASVAALRAQFQERVDLLEEELMKMATELGRVRATAARDRASTTATTEQELVVSKERVVQLESTVAEVRRQLASAQEASSSSSSGPTAAAAAAAAVAADGPSSPQSPRTRGGWDKSSAQTDMLMAQLAAMETQVITIETRFLRRERELEALVEETRASNKVERARLAALHAQDLHEKDEQLLRFKSELEVLVAALKAHSLGQQQEAHRMLEQAAASTMQMGGDYDYGDEDGMSLNMSQQRSVAMAS